jgi:Ca2+-binding EF-hand superfamily protein
MQAFEGAIGSETQAKIGKLASGRNSEITFDQFLQLLVPQASSSQIHTMTSWLPQSFPTAFKPKVKRQRMSEYELANFRRVFQKYDYDKDGKLEMWELREALDYLKMGERGEGREAVGFREFLELVKPAHVEIPSDLEGN